MVYVDNSTINQYKGIPYDSESDEFGFINIEDFREDLSPEQRDRLINFFSEAVHSENKSILY